MRLFRGVGHHPGAIDGDQPRAQQPLIGATPRAPEQTTTRARPRGWHGTGRSWRGRAADRPRPPGTPHPPPAGVRSFGWTARPCIGVGQHRQHHRRVIGRATTTIGPITGRTSVRSSSASTSTTNRARWPSGRVRHRRRHQHQLLRIHSYEVAGHAQFSAPRTPRLPTKRAHHVDSCDPRRPRPRSRCDYAAPRGHAFITRALYLPSTYRSRGISVPGPVRRGCDPAEVGFATKPALAADMITHAVAAGPHPRQWAGIRLAVAANGPVAIDARPIRVDQLPALLTPWVWQKRSAGS